MQEGILGVAESRKTILTSDRGSVIQPLMQKTGQIQIESAPSNSDHKGCTFNVEMIHVSNWSHSASLGPKSLIMTSFHSKA